MAWHESDIFLGVRKLNYLIFHMTVCLIIYRCINANSNAVEYFHYNIFQTARFFAWQLIRIRTSHCHFLEMKSSSLHKYNSILNLKMTRDAITLNHSTLTQILVNFKLQLLLGLCHVIELDIFKITSLLIKTNLKSYSVYTSAQAI